jgi:hypothetical protein
MTINHLLGIPARLACLVVAGAWMPAAVANVDAAAPGSHPACGGAADPIEVQLPLEMQASLFHSLPIAGLLVTPDDIAERVLLDPRLRATASQPSSGKGAAYPIPESSAVSTRADLSH